MSFCENCGAKLQDGQKFCESCGQPVSNNDNEIIEEEVKTSSSILYCENCGAKLTEGALFCDACGTQIPKTYKATKESTDSSENLDLTIFKKDNWSSLWVSSVFNSKDVGIILADVKNLVLGESREDIENAISNYMKTAKEKNNVRYYLLDPNENAISPGDNSNIEEIIDILDTICRVASPKYLFILGNENIIPQISWENECYDNDEYVTSDLAYSTLDLNSPFEGQKYNFDNILRVGRLPNTLDTNFSDLLNNYSENVKQDVEEISTLGVSALQWEDTSNHVYRRFSDVNCNFSPDFTTNNYEEYASGYENFLYFNVHGSDQTQFWYGQNEDYFPEASDPNLFDYFKNPFVIGVEACYGGKFANIDDKLYSTVLNAFNNKCVSMLGSSAIAYGTPTGPGASADILIGRYLHDMIEGYSAGDSYVNGLKELINGEDTANDMAIKTLAEFALYGDPSYRRSRNVERKGLSLKKMLGGKVQKGINVPLPDVRRAIRLSLCEVDAKIANPIKKHVIDKYEGFEDSEPSFYEMANSKYKQASFGKSTDFGQSFVKIYFDDNGKIVKEMVSK